MTVRDSARLLERLERLASQVVTREELVARLDRAEAEDRPLRVKMGIDPTFTDVHLGHTVPIRVLALFQEHGHLPVLILGDATARLGDPTGRNEQRPPLTREEVERNAATYLEQIGRVLDVSHCEVHRNSEWFGGMDFFDAVRLAGKATVARMLERDDFQKRIRAGLPIHLHELLYPLMQGWDSVEVRADVEVGGNDQLFNLHVGRMLQEREGLPPQVCVTTPLLLGTDGRKMSKTAGNHVPLLGDPNDLFGKVMSLADEGMAEWFRLLTDLADEEVEALLAGHPREAKDRLAREVLTAIHDAEAAAAAADEFRRRFRDKELPSEVPLVTLPAGEHALSWVLREAGLAASSSEARRLLAQGGVRVAGEVVRDERAGLVLTAGSEPVLLQAGKRRFARVAAAG